MKIETFERDGVLVAKLFGEVDLVDADDFAGGLVSIATTNPKAVVLDFSEVTYLASQGLGLLVQFNRSVRAGGGRVTMCNVSQALRMIFDSVRLTQLITCTDTVDAAAARATAGT